MIIQGNFNITLTPEEMTALRDYLNSSYNFADQMVFKKDEDIIHYVAESAKAAAETSILRIVAQATKYEALQKLTSSGEVEIGYGHGV